MSQHPPLKGLKVIDITQIMAGPYCTMMLGDMGADVIKIEKPDGGDDIRRAGPPFITGESATFLNISRNKRSIVVDFKMDEGVEIVRQMARDSDVLVQNLRPGRLDAIGLGYDDLHCVNPQLIYATISGYGRTGPDKDRPGFDLMAQGATGMMSVTGHPGQPPVKSSIPITDVTAGMFAAFGILGAYTHRLKTGEGQHVDTSLMEAGVALTLWESAIFFGSGLSPGPNGSAHQISAPYQAVRTDDGYITIGGANQANWERICHAIERTDLLEDQRFLDNQGRMSHRTDLVETLEATFETQTSAYWLETLQNAGVPCGPINDMAQVYADPQVLARDMLVELEHPTLGTIKNVGSPLKFTETPTTLHRPPPLLGQHTDEVLADYGYSANDIATLRERKVIQ
jgi:crotonobetainyl-CoA:carnitine CoA-transferase CaiB-like acyl-CoA transferase